MAWTSSNVNTQYVVQMGNNNVKPATITNQFLVALFNNAVTPTQSATVANNTYSATWAGGVEASATGYTAGGGGATPTHVAGAWQQFSGSSINIAGLFSNTNMVWTITSNMAAQYGCIVYDTLAGSPYTNIIMSWNWFGGTGYSITGSGTFTVSWGSAAGSTAVNTFTC